MNANARTSLLLVVLIVVGECSLASIPVVIEQGVFSLITGGGHGVPHPKGDKGAHRMQLLGYEK